MKKLTKKIPQWRKLEKAARAYFDPKDNFRTYKYRGGHETGEARALRKMAKALQKLESK